MSNKLLPDKIETYSQEQLSKFLKVIKRNYILDNVQLVDNFFYLFTRCRYLIVKVIPERSYLLGRKPCFSYPHAVSDYVCISSLYRIIELKLKLGYPRNTFRQKRSEKFQTTKIAKYSVDVEGIILFKIFHDRSFYLSFLKQFSKKIY